MLGGRHGMFRHGFGGFGGFDPRRKWLNDRMVTMVLKTLSDKPMSGFEVLSALEERFEHGFFVGPEGVYPLLQLLVDRGHAIALQEDGRTRYVLTEDGRACLEEREANGEAEECGHGGFAHHFGGIPAEVSGELHRTRGEVIDLVMTLKRRLHGRGFEKDQLKQILGVVNHALGEIKTIAK